MSVLLADWLASWDYINSVSCFILLWGRMLTTMLYCEECREKNKWPKTFMASFGACEECFRTKSCYDLPAHILFGNKPVCEGTEAAVCEDIHQRQQLGINKYGVTVRDNQLTLKQWLQHAYEECLDQAVYLKRAIEEIDK